MDVILDSNLFSDTEIRRLNYCRLYLQAITLSDLTQASGRKLDPAMLQGNPDHSSSVSRWNHVNQARPVDAHWFLWRRANQLWSNTAGELKQPLLRWTVPVTAQRRRWRTYGDTKGRVYLRHDRQAEQHTTQELYIRYQVAPKRDPQHTIVSYAIPPHDQQTKMHLVPLPSNVTPIESETSKAPPSITATYDGSLIRKLKPRAKHRLTRTNLQNQDFHSYLIAKTEPWEAELLQHVELKYDAYSTYEKMQETFQAAGDGSVKYEHNGSFGWTISTSSGDRLVQAYGPVRGFKPTSYRAEGYGMLSILRFVKHLQTYCDVTPTWKWTLTSDNISLVDKKVNGNQHDEHGNLSAQHQASGDRPHDWSIWRESNDHDIEDPSGNWADSDSSQTNITLEPD